MFGVGVTTHNRPDIFAATMMALRRFTPPGTPIVVVDDGSEIAVAGADWRHDFPLGVASAKNRCLELLEAKGCDDIFLFDDDTVPTARNWWRPFIDSPEPHLMHNFASAPSHWPIAAIGGDSDHIAYDRPRGCLLYVTRAVLDRVGGLHTAFGRHGGEHANWSDRIHAAGLTRWRYASPKKVAIRCLDEDRRGISSVTNKQNQRWRHVDADALPEFADFHAQPIPVLVPRRPDHGYRDKVWAFLRDKFWSTLPAYRIVEGVHLDGPFNRSAGVNIAAGLAGNWPVAVIADSDTWVPAGQLDAAVEAAARTGSLASALTSVIELGEQCSAGVLAGRMPFAAFGIDKVRTVEMETQSSMLAVPRGLWSATRGFDERFVGWGGEDNAYWRTATIMGGKPQRIPGHAYHLWHPAAADKHGEGYDDNAALWRRYATTRTIEQLRRIRP